MVLVAIQGATLVRHHATMLRAERLGRVQHYESVLLLQCVNIRIYGRLALPMLGESQPIGRLPVATQAFQRFFIGHAVCGQFRNVADNIDLAAGPAQSLESSVQPGIEQGVS